MDQAVTTVIQTDVPARLDRLPWSRFHALLVIAPRRHLDPGRARGDDRRLDRARAHRWSHARADPGSGRAHGLGLCGGHGAGRADLRLADRYGRTAGDLQRDARVYVLGVFGSALSWTCTARAVAHPDRDRGRRRIRGDQLRHRRDHACAPPRPRQSRGQRELLASAPASARSRPCCSRTAPSCRSTSAGGSPSRWRCPRPSRDLAPTLRAREPALAHHARPRRARAPDRLRHRARVAACGHDLPDAHGTLSVRPRARFGIRLVLRTMLFAYPRRSVLVIA